MEVEPSPLICLWLPVQPAFNPCLTQKTKSNFPRNPLVVVVYSNFPPTTTKQKGPFNRFGRFKMYNDKSKTYGISNYNS